ncbi:uncharacterized protein [Rutidosis leptorrhynchoides]|uniref:uncharacterized protein n=1 Tax=Rutidosis leptorrhynchoides TaxID=125765 RepID=UPI003A992E69
MEVLTLMLRRNIAQRGDFRFHPKCDKLKIVNLCFADDLFLFSRADVASVKLFGIRFKSSNNAPVYLLACLKALLSSRMLPQLRRFKFYLHFHLKKAACLFTTWRLLTLKYSLWVKWIHTYKLSSHNIWEVSIVAGSSWSWRKLLQIRPTVRKFFIYRLGNGKTASAWFDEWCVLGPLCEFISLVDINNAGFSKHAKVSDIVVSSRFNWLHNWLAKYPLLATVQAPYLNNMEDKLVWRGIDAIDCNASVSCIWESIRPRAQVLCRDAITKADRRRSADWIMAKLCFGASVYSIWQERNSRLFNKGKKTEEQLFESVRSNVRLKLTATNFKSSNKVEQMKIDWQLF